jgi:hypothetical protein
MTSSVRRWVAGVGFVGGAALAAAMVGTAGTPAARADNGSVPTDIGLLNAAETNVLDGFSLTGHTDTAFPDVIGKLEVIQTPLLSSDNSFVSGFGEALFNGPDQQLAQASETFLSAAQAVAADPTSLAPLSEYASAGFQLVGSIFGEIPSAFVGKLTDQIFDIGGFDSTSASAAADALTSASSAAATPDEVIGQAITDLNQSTTLLDTASTADLGTRSADLLSNSEALPAQLDTGLTEMASIQDQLSPSDQALLVGVDEQLVTAAQNLLPADQGFIAADQAGELSTNSATSADWTLLGADLDVLGAAIYADVATLFGVLTGGLDPSSAADLASSLDPAAVVDPSIFADLLSSIGF